MEPKMNLQYANQSILYTTQFIASMGDEEVVLDCGSIVAASGNDQHSLPIHTRLALPWTAVKRLHGLLEDLMQTRSENAKPTGATNDAANDAARASLPPLSVPTPGQPDAKVGR